MEVFDREQTIIRVAIRIEVSAHPDAAVMLIQRPVTALTFSNDVLPDSRAPAPLLDCERLQGPFEEPDLVARFEIPEHAKSIFRWLARVNGWVMNDVHTRQ